MCVSTDEITTKNTDQITDGITEQNYPDNISDGKKI